MVISICVFGERSTPLWIPCHCSLWHTKMKLTCQSDFSLNFVFVHISWDHPRHVYQIAYTIHTDVICLRNCLIDTYKHRYYYYYDRISHILIMLSLIWSWLGTDKTDFRHVQCWLVVPFSFLVFFFFFVWTPILNSIIWVFHPDTCRMGQTNTPNAPGRYFRSDDTSIWITNAIFDSGEEFIYIIQNAIAIEIEICRRMKF